LRFALTNDGHILVSYPFQDSTQNRFLSTFVNLRVASLGTILITHLLAHTTSCI